MQLQFLYMGGTVENIAFDWIACACVFSLLAFQNKIVNLN